MELQKKIEDFLYSDSEELEVSGFIKSELKEYQKSFINKFHQSNGKNLLVKHTKFFDLLIKTIYKFILRKHFYNYTPLQNQIPISIYALGSYGREELSLYSDIDLMIVYEDIKGYNIKEIIESILNMAWDSGFKLSHRVHELGDLLSASREDHTIKTAMIESRFICGSKFLDTSTQNILKQIRKDEPNKFLKAKVDEYYKRADNNPIKLRANIKNSEGGIRDLNTLFWIANTLYGVNKLKDLIPIINENDYSKLMKNVDYLFKIRVAIHAIEQKKEDTIRLELIPDIAKLLNLKQSECARKIYQALNEIKTYTHIYISKLTKEYLPIDMRGAKILNNELFIVDRKLYAHNLKKSADLISLLEYILKYNNDISYYNITFVSYLMSSRLRQKDINQNGVIKSLFYQKNLYRLLFALYYSKNLFRIIYPLLKVRNLPQFDGYHIYPVDLHSLRTMDAIENIDDKFIKDIFDSFDEDQKAVVRVATLLHDSGKGRKRDHSILGANIVKAFAKEIGFSKEEQNIIYILIRYHILMSNTAAREDIYNEKVIYSFNSKIRDPLILKMLYVLTYCDIESVGKGTYNNFNAGLLKELYLLSLEAFNNDAMISEAAKREKIEKRVKKNPSFLALKKSTQKKLLRVESNLLFFKYSIDKIVELTKWVEQKKESYEYKILSNNQLVIEILSSKEINIGYLLGKLSHYDITTMDIFKIEKGLKYFKIIFEEDIDKSEIGYIKDIIESSFDMSLKIKPPKLNIKKDEIDIFCEHSSSYARMKLNTIDQRGLLANIIGLFDEMGIEIASAKIQTMRNIARNLFLIEKNGKFCDVQELIIKKLTMS